LADSDSEADADVDSRTKTALFRHSLVAPLVDLEYGEQKRELQRISKRTHKLPSGRRGKVGKSTLKRWWKAFREGGFEALKPALRSDHGQSRKIPEEWVKKAISLRRELPSRTARDLKAILERLEGCPTINAHTLDTVLRRRGCTRRLAGKKPKKRFIRWTAKHVNNLWQGDATPGLWLPDPRDLEKWLQTKLFLNIDDVSRLVPHAEFFFDEKLPRMERVLKMGLSRRGLCDIYYVDNGSVYRALQLKASLAELGIKLTHSKKYCPQGRGKIERIFGVIQEHFFPEAEAEIKAGRIKTLQQLNEALWAWLECVYHRWEHSEIKTTPLKAYEAGIQHVRAADPVKLARAFLWRYTRKVSSNGFISLFGNSYTVDPVWNGQTIELRLDPFDMSRVDVYQDNRPVARAVVREQKKSRLLDIEPLAPPPPVEPSGVNFLEMLKSEYRQQLKNEIGPIAFAEAIKNKEA
jgi:transposase InsO family protein